MPREPAERNGFLVPLRDAPSGGGTARRVPGEAGGGGACPETPSSPELGRTRGRFPGPGMGAAMPPGMSGSKPRLLIADDEEALLAVLGEYLGCCGYDVTRASRPSEARELLTSNEYAVVITDLRFWGPNGTQGLAIARTARERMPRGRVFLLTAYMTPEVEREAREIGVDALLEKPIPLWELAQRIMAGTAVHQDGR